MGFSIIKKITNDQLLTKIVKNSLWSILGSISLRISKLVSSIAIARILGVKGFGEFSIIQSTVEMLSIFANFGLGPTATKYISGFKQTNPQKAGEIITLVNLLGFIFSVFFSLSYIFLSRWISSNVISNVNLTDKIQLSASLLFFTAMTNLQMSILSGLEAFKIIAVVNLIYGLFYVIFIALGSLLDGLRGTILGLTGATFIVYMLNNVIINKQCFKFNINTTSRIKNFKKLVNEIFLHFSFPAFLSSSMVAPVTWICNIILVNQPNGYIEVAIFNAANQWRNALLFIPYTLGPVFLSILSDLIENQNTVKYRKVLIMGLILYSLTTFMFSVPILFLSKLIMSSYGEEFKNSHLVLILLLITSNLQSVGIMVGYSVASLGKMWIGFFFNFFWAFILLILSLFLIILLKMGALGLSLAYLISYAVDTFGLIIFLSLQLNGKSKL